jgi:hypothetical protein
LLKAFKAEAATRPRGTGATEADAISKFLLRY